MEPHYINKQTMTPSHMISWRRLLSQSLLAALLILTLLAPLALSGQDFYKLLDIGRDASTKDIRVAFKKLALKMHPDKNPGDPKAHDNFVVINRAYEVLKDDDLRKKYDRFGEEGLKEDGQRGQWNRYESWQFYKTEFGLYDEDQEIVTLSKSDFDQSVFGEDIWFVNFYSPRCHHCHELAPAWREFAKEVEGVIRVGAVNCWEDNPICTAQGVQRFPTLKVYPANEEYTGARNLQYLVKHALRLVSATVHSLFPGNFKTTLLDEKAKLQPWVISYCGAPDAGDSSEVSKVGCLDDEDQFKLAAILNTVVNVAAIDCVASSKLCQKLDIEDSTIKFYPQGKKVTPKGGKELEFEEPKYIANEVLKLLPDITVISADEFNSAREALKAGTSHTPMLVYFTDDKDGQSLELRKLSTLLPGFKVGLFDCAKDALVCQQLYLTHDLPKAALFKAGGEYELHHGRTFSQDIAAFAKHSLTSRLHMLSPDDFNEKVMNSGQTWFVDFFSPKCPPCRQLINELRIVSQYMTNINFGTVDCTVHNALCVQQRVQSYPTCIMYNDTKPHMNVGFHRAADIIDFIEDTLNPKVVTLDATLFNTLVKQRQKSDLWLVDFYAPWCGPCQSLMPEWRKLAKMLNGTANVGTVDCVANSALCQEVSVFSYPTIRVFPIGSAGIGGTSDFRGWQRDANSLLGWAFGFLPSIVEVITQNNFRSKVLRSEEPWIIDFYSPHCAPCQQYMPKLERIAKELQGYVHVGKVDCSQWQGTCNQASIQSYPSVRIYKGTDQKGYSQNWYGEQVWHKEPEQFIPFLKQRFTNKLQAAPVKDEL